MQNGYRYAPPTRPCRDATWGTSRALLCPTLPKNTHPQPPVVASWQNPYLYRHRGARHLVPAAALRRAAFRKSSVHVIQCTSATSRNCIRCTSALVASNHHEDVQPCCQVAHPATAVIARRFLMKPFLHLTLYTTRLWPIHDSLRLNYTSGPYTLCHVPTPAGA